MANQLCSGTLAPQKSVVLADINSWLIGSLMVTTTLHTSSIPPWGMLWFSTRRMGTNPASPVITNCYCLYPSQHVCTTLSILLQNPLLKTTLQLSQDISPWMPSLSSHDHRLTLTVIVPVGINTTINDFKFCMQYK